MFTKIAVATDGSPLANKAVQSAADLARQFGSELTIFHVLMHGEPPESLKRMAEVEHLVAAQPHPDVSLSNLPSSVIAVNADLERNRLNHEIVAIVGEMVIRQARNCVHDSGVTNVKNEILDGQTADEILAAAKRVGADLVVLGSRGLNPLKGLFMGSISQKVSQRADCACLIVK